MCGWWRLFSGMRLVGSQTVCSQVSCQSVTGSSGLTYLGTAPAKGRGGLEEHRVVAMGGSSRGSLGRGVPGRVQPEQAYLRSKRKWGPDG